MLNVFQVEFRPLCDKQHPRANHRRLGTMNETDEEVYDDQTSDASDHEQENWDPHRDEHGFYVCTEEDCKDRDQHLCDGDEEVNTAFLNFQDSRDVIRHGATADVVIKKRSDHGEKGLSKGSGQRGAGRSMSVVKGKGFSPRGRPNLQNRAAFERIEKGDTRTSTSHAA